MKIVIDAPIYTDGAVTYSIGKKGPFYRVQSNTTGRVPDCPLRLGMGNALEDIWRLAREKNLQLVDTY